MTLDTSIGNKFHDPTLIVYVGGRSVNAIRASVDYGYDTVSGTADVTLAIVPSWLQLRTPIEIVMGYDGFGIPVFTGFVEEDGRNYFPQEARFKAATRLKQSQYPYPSELTYSSQTDTTIVDDLLTKAGVPNLNIGGAGQTFGAVQDVVLREGQAPFELINELDQVTGYITFDVPGAVLRREWKPIPTDASMWSYTQGTNILRINRPRTVAGLHNKVVVTGLSQDDSEIKVAWQADNPLVPNPPQYVTFNFRSDLIETTAYANTVGSRLLEEKNRIVEEIELEVPGNPRLRPGATVALTASNVDINTATPFWIKHVTHTLDNTGYVTRLLLEGGAGQAGYQVPVNDDGNADPGTLPVAVISTRVTAENLDLGSGVEDVYTVNADGTGSYDPDGSISSYSWSNDQNATTGTDSRYGVNFTQAEWDNGPVISLQVTDADGNTDTTTATVESSNDVPLLNRNLYVAALGVAEASPDGGRTWNTWTPSSGDVKSTPEIALEDASYFGLDNGELYRTEDYLATDPTLINTFAAQVNVIWVNEADGNRVTVALTNGQILRTTDAGSNWTLLKTYGQQVLALVESVFNPGEYRVATSDAIKITFDDFANDSDIISWGGGTIGTGPARRISLSNFNNYGSAHLSNPVLREDGTEITFPSATGRVDGLTHHIRDDILYAADLDPGDGTTTRIWEKAAGVTNFTQVGSIANGGQPITMIRDGDSPLVLYLAADNGLYKTTDGGANWYLVRDYSGAGLRGNFVGYGSAPWHEVTAATLISQTSSGKVLSLGTEPDGWRDVGFDDSGWSAPVSVNTGSDPVTGTTYISYTGADNVPGDAEWLYRREFELSDGFVASATLTYRVDNYVQGFWVNNVFVESQTTLETPATEYSISIDRLLFEAGATNVIAAKIANAEPARLTPTGFSYKLEIA